MDIIYKEKRGRDPRLVDLVKLSAQTGYPIISPYPGYVELAAKELGIEIPRTIPLWYFGMGKAKPEGKVLVDDIEYVMEYLTNLDVVAATLVAE